MTTARPISEMFSLIADYAIATKQAPINGKVWKVKLNDTWSFTVNGKTSSQKIDDLNDCELKPFECYVEFNGWPAGIFTPFDGCFAAGSLANEDSFCAALKSAIKQGQPEKESGR